MSISTRWLNHILWCLAVKERRGCLPTHYDVAYLAAVVGQKTSTVSNQLSLMESIGLISINHEKCICILGIHKCHKKLKWRDSPYGETKGTSNDNLEGEKEKEKENEKEKEKKNKQKKIDEEWNKTPQIDDPYFPVDKKPMTEPVIELCSWIHKKYNSDDIPSSTMPIIIHLSEIYPLETIKLAIENKIKLCDSKGRKPEFRPRIKNLFDKDLAVEELAQMDVADLISSLGRDSDLESFSKMIEEENNAE